jgi:polysaccharide chain length determinant protein (PEP-CTERM system associated)
MITNRELTMQDYVGMLRRRVWIILIPALTAPLAGFLVSYAFPAKYTSQSVVLVEGQKVPETMVQPVVSEDITARVSTLEQQVLAESKLRPLVQRIYPQKSPSEVGGMIDTIRTNMAVEPVPSDLLAIGTSSPKGKKPNTSPFPGFYVKYTAPSAREAQMICNELTTLLVDENSRQIAEAATGTSEVLNRGIEDAKNNLDGMDAKLAEFKKQHTGELPTDADNNLKILTGLNSQLEANTQTLNRAQQDKSYTESILAQQVAAWKSSQSSTSPETLQKQLSDLQTQLLQLQSKYTDDHPDVIKTKADIAAVKKKMADINKAAASGTDDTSDKASLMEPADVRQLRLQLHQYEDLITAATRDQKRLQQEIVSYQSRVSLSPAVEEEYKQLTRDYDNAQKNYEDLLAKKSSADLTVKMNNQAVGERMFPLQSADLPDKPSFPNRLFFGLGGLAAGFAIGGGIALLLELKDNSIRNERDAEAVLELPTLIAVPWIGTTSVASNGNGNGHSRFKFWGRKKALENGSAVAKA